MYATTVNLFDWEKNTTGKREKQIIFDALSYDKI